jgi:TetR/AcrR family transcriptional repressor of nem operon
MSSPPGSREKILQCAKELFYQVGYQSTSVDDILRQCGVAKSNFYYHFKTKEQLAFEVLELRIAELEAVLLRSLRNREMPPAERLRAFFADIQQAQEEIAKRGGCPFGNFAAALPNTEGDARHERFRLRLSQLFRRLEDAMTDCLAEGVAQGQFRSDIAPSQMAAFLVAALQGLLILTKTHRDTAPLVNGLSVAERLLRA